VWNSRAAARCGGTGVSYAAWWTPKKEKAETRMIFLGQPLPFDAQHYHAVRKNFVVVRHDIIHGFNEGQETISNARPPCWSWYNWTTIELYPSFLELDGLIPVFKACETLRNN
jgi:hypothetical protein